MLDAVTLDQLRTLSRQWTKAASQLRAANCDEPNRWSVRLWPISKRNWESSSSIARRVIRGSPRRGVACFRTRAQWLTTLTDSRPGRNQCGKDSSPSSRSPWT